MPLADIQYLLRDEVFRGDLSYKNHTNKNVLEEAVKGQIYVK